MAEELKIRIHDYRKVEERLVQLGAKFSREANVKDTYFNQEGHDVLKITESDEGDFLVELKSKDGKFEIVKHESIDNADELKEELSSKFGVKCVLKKKRRFFGFGDYIININLIEDVGEFLVVEGKKPTKYIITEKMGIKDPEFITVPFSELKK